jgi:hypothetical protein
VNEHRLFFSQIGRPSRAVFFLFAMAMLTGTIQAALDHAISLRILDASNGKPIQKATAVLIKWNKMGQTEEISQGVTNAEGIVVFHLQEPLPDRIGFSPDELKYCSDLAFPTEEIVNGGLLAQNKCQARETKLSFSRKPGEITLFANKPSRWDKVRRELP